MTAPGRPAPQRRRLIADRSGSVAPFLGFTMLMLICCIGFGIDIGRATLVRAKLSSALDSAGLAVGARLTTSDYNKDARNFVDANFKANYAAATVTEVTATPNASKTVITLTATATMPTAFMKLIGNSMVTVRVTTEVTRASSGLEVALVLDNTGSMDNSGSMPTLKSASKDLLNIVFGDASSTQNIYAAVVPFSHAVNIGSSRSAWTTGTRPTNWSGCVRARTDGLDKTDTPPTNAKFRAYQFPFSLVDISEWLRAGANSFCPEPVTPLTNSKATLTAAIDAMQARGNTHINLGAVWGWRVLSPQWRGLWGGDAKLPLDYGVKSMSKAMVLMTDGDNTMNSSVYTAYGMLSEGQLGTTNDPNVAKTALDTRMRDVCNSMKTAGVVIYAVAFDDPEPATKTLMQNCATSAANYFDAKDKTSLLTAFRAIGDALSNLRISK